MKPGSSDGGGVVRSTSTFCGLVLSWWGSCANPILAVLPKYWHLSGLDLSPTISFHLQQDFTEQAEHGLVWCLHMSLTSLLVVTDKSTAFPVAEVSVMLNRNNSLFYTHQWTSLRHFAFHLMFLQSMSLSVSPVLLTPPVVPAWVDPDTVFLPYLEFIAQNTVLYSMLWPPLAPSKVPAATKKFKLTFTSVCCHSAVPSFSPHLSSAAASWIKSVSLNAPYLPSPHPSWIPVSSAFQQDEPCSLFSPLFSQWLSRQTWFALSAVWYSLLSFAFTLLSLSSWSVQPHPWNLNRIPSRSRDNTAEKL